MPFGKELSHIIEEQITRSVAQKSTATDSGGIATRSGADEGRLAQIEANLQRLADKFAAFLTTQKNSKRSIVEYGLKVIALHELRLAITDGRAVFADSDEPLDIPYTYLQLSAAGAERQIRYIYLNNAGVVLESSTDPTNMGTEYIPLALVDVWSGVQEITQDKLQDIRPRAGSEDNTDSSNTNLQVNGNATLYCPDTGNDSFVVAATTTAGLCVNVTSGRALVGGEVINAEGGLLDLSNHRNVTDEFLVFSDGITTQYNLYHQSVSNVVVAVNDVAAAVTVNEEEGSITFATAPEVGAKITASYSFSGNYVLVFLVERAQTNDGKPVGVIGWKVGSNRNLAQPPDLTQYQHAIAKVDMSSAIEAITDLLIDNAYEVQNLTQYDLQYGEKLGSASLRSGAVTADKIAAGSIDAGKITTGAIEADKIAAGAITTKLLATDSILADMIQAGTIKADMFEDSVWGDLSQAIRFVKSILGGEQSWSIKLNKSDLLAGIRFNVDVMSQTFPAIKLDTQQHWDDGSVWNTDSQTWDIPTASSGYWESASIDYGAEANLQAEFWTQFLCEEELVNITVKARYSNDDLTWTDYETLKHTKGMGYHFWIGTLQRYRYFKIKVELATTNTGKYEILAYPEIRAANCQIGAEDMAPGALNNNIAILSGSIAHGGTIPLPAGYDQNHCKWFVSFREMYFSGDVDGNDSEYCYADANRVVTVMGNYQRQTYAANYLIIGIR
ncbi:MAG: hypothetical protein H6Q72_1903 [Firmicutes bacterium]|nr:hypothetical protein [Bacillota bacterium]